MASAIISIIVAMLVLYPIASKYIENFSREFIINEEGEYFQLLKSGLIIPILSQSKVSAQAVLHQFEEMKDTNAIIVKTDAFSVLLRDSKVLREVAAQSESLTEFGPEIIYEDKDRWIFSFSIIDSLDEPVFSDANLKSVIGRVFIEINKSSQQTLIRTMMTLMALILVAGLLFIVLVLFIVFRTVTIPLRKIIFAMTHYKDNSSHVIQYSWCPTDIRYMTDTYNNMLDLIEKHGNKIKLHANTLEQKIEEGLADIKEKNIDLELAKIRAEKANKAKDHFVANVSHEIRTPIQTIITSVELLRHNNNNEAFDIIDRSADQLLELIEQILDYSIIDSKQEKLNQCKINPCQLIESVTALEKPILQKNKNQLTFNCNGYEKDPSFLILIDKVKFKQVLRNLISNANKYTHIGMIAVTVSNIKKDDTAYCQIQVADTGCGISKEALEYIFHAFFQAGLGDGMDAQKRANQGIGLGLSISKNLLKQMHGTISVESEIEKGSVFTLLFPIASNDENSDPCVTGVNQVLDSGHPARGLNILIAEDHVVFRAGLSQMLGQYNAITQAKDGQAVIDLFNDGKIFDIIIIDVHMPNIDGLETVKRLIKAQQILPRQVIFLTADITDAKINEVKELGCQMLYKPCKLGQLNKILIKATRDSVSQKN